MADVDSVRRDFRENPPRTVVHLFPGQGDFSVGPLVRTARTVPRVRAAVAEVFGQAEDVAAEFGIPPLADALLSDTPPGGRELAQGPVGTAQLALFCSSVAVHRALCGIGRAPDRAVGVSFGEIAALTAAGAFDVPGGARIACLLAHHLQRCEGALTLLGAGEARANSLLRETGSAAVVVACVNDPGETVLSGPLPEMRAAEERAQRQGLSVTRLRLPFSSHHPSLAGPSEAFAAAIRPVPARRCRFPVHSAVRGGPYRPGDDLHRGLADCLVRPARLPNVLHQVTTPSPALLLEAGTGRALTRNVRRTVPPSAARALAPLGEPGFSWARRGGTHRDALLVPSALPPTEASR
ncbi:ACP S-malonyltransferase [Streptomyces sp. NPDC053427]|uniref:ACP S-malonyltransferase n=1 Tax=Streptomyces sp. NPDC053427 TaxID=3365701 RepID=UPI0037D22DA2